MDATIIAAPSSTKNAEGERDPEMHQTKKGNEWHIGMKAHIAVDAHSGLVHTVTATAANAHVWADSGYRGAQSRVTRDGPQWHIAARPSDIAKLAKNTAHVVTLFALSNLWMARKKLMAMASRVHATNSIAALFFNRTAAKQSTAQTTEEPLFTFGPPRVARLLRRVGATVRGV